MELFLLPDPLNKGMIFLVSHDCSTKLYTFVCNIFPFTEFIKLLNKFQNKQIFPVEPSREAKLSHLNVIH